MSEAPSSQCASPSRQHEDVNKLDIHPSRPSVLLPRPRRIISPATKGEADPDVSPPSEADNSSICRPHSDASETQHIQAPELWTEDLQLMHHYTLVTCHTLPRAAEVLHIWQTAIVKLAFTHGPLLHQILAFSAFHMAHLNPGQHHQYSVLALQHQTEASRGLRTYLANMVPDNSEACFTAASFLIFGAFARLSLSPSAIDDTTQPSLNDLIEVFTFIRGMNVVLQESENITQRGCLVDLFKLPVGIEPVSSLEELCEALGDLNDRVDHGSAEHNPETVRIVKSAISILVGSIQEAARTTSAPELRTVTVWPIALSEEFLALMQERDSLALVVVAYYCAIVHDSQVSAWFTRGWGMSVASDVRELLSPPYRDLCEWALHHSCG